RMPKPGNPDPLAKLKALCIFAKRHNLPHDLMTRRDIGLMNRQITFADVQISMTDATGQHLNQNLALFWLRHWL
ncbi:hypothetical protein L0P10_17930, partial [Eggerthella lenta]|nr:hypothetical protein [Eggerthella lenta]